jgi:hypothetical protein
LDSLRSAVQSTEKALITSTILEVWIYIKVVGDTFKKIPLAT